MTPPHTVSVFVSSTSLDLRPEREAVRDAVLRMKQTQFVGMEYFGSRDETTRGASLEEVDGSLVYVGIVGARYGSGIVEAEYRRARELGLPCFIYFKEDSTVAEDARETDPAQTAKLEALKAELGREHIVSTFNNPDDLAARVTADLHRWLSDEYISGVSSPPLPTLHQLRAPVGDFVGREKEIEELLSTLRGGGSAAITGISGMGGIGKTELSFCVAERLRDTYPDAQLVLDMRGTDERPRDPSDALASCIRAFLGLEQRLPDDLGELTRLYRSTLEGRRALILLDNAHDSAQVRPLLPPSGSALLVTSRNAVTLPGMKSRVTLDQLSPAEARELLTGIAPHVAPDVADQICFLCGYLPLAIRAAGSLLTVTADLDPSDYASQLSDERTRLEHIGAEGVDISVEASFNLSYDRLSPDAQRIFRQLAVFPTSFDARAEEAICEDSGHKHLSELLRRSLVLYNPNSRRYRLHDLVRLFADSRMGDEERNAGQMRHARRYSETLAECKERYKKGSENIKNGLALFDVEWRNFEAGQKWACQHATMDETAANLCSIYPDAGVHMLNLRQHPRERIRWLEAALEAARQLKDREAEGVHLGNLGGVYARLGETYRAIEFFERRLEIAREIGDRRGEGAVLGNLGVAYKDLGEVRHAIEFHEQALAINRDIGNRLAEGDNLGNLGVAYKDLGETRQAIEFYEQRLAVAREIGDRRGESYTLGNLGNTYLALGDTSRALELFDKVLTVARELGDQYSEANALYAISRTLYTRGDRAQATAYAEAAVRIFERIESPHAEKVRAKLDEWRVETTERE